MLTLLQRVDLILIKALSSADATTASENAGFYSASADVANITYQIIASVTFVIFPLISQSTFSDDRSRTRSYIANTLRYTLIIMALTATLFSAQAARVLSVIYKEAYQAGAPSLRILAIGILFFGLLFVLTTIITASGQPRISLTIAAITLIVSAALNAMLIPSYGLSGAALATSVAMLIGTLLAGGYLWKRFGAFASMLSTIRIVACAAAIYGASFIFSPKSKVMIIAELAMLSIAYLIALVVTGEFGRAELQLISRVLKRG